MCEIGIGICIETSPSRNALIKNKTYVTDSMRTGPNFIQKVFKIFCLDKYKHFTQKIDKKVFALAKKQCQG